MSRPASPLRALALGLLDVVRAPMMLIGIAVITLVIAVPFAAVLHSRLQASLSVQPQVSLDDTEIDPEWWMEFREHARGLEATFTPAVLGFAATLDGVSNVLDGKAMAPAIITPLVISVVAWAFIWGAALRRFQDGRGSGLSGFVSAGASHAISFIVIAIAAAAINLILYVTLHKLLFGPVHSVLVSLTTTERDAFLVRTLLYVMFFAVVATVSLVADYARVSAIAGRANSPGAMLRESIAFITTHKASVALLYVATGAIFIVVTIAYGSLEIVGGSQVGGWRAVAIGQAYVLVRLAIRLTFAASELRLFTTNHAATMQ